MFSARFWNGNTPLLQVRGRMTKVVLVIVADRRSYYRMIVTSDSTVCNRCVKIRSYETLVNHGNLTVIKVVCRALLSIVVFQHNSLLILVVLLGTLNLLLGAQQCTTAVTYVAHILDTLSDGRMYYLICAWTLVRGSRNNCILRSHVVVSAEFLIHLWWLCYVICTMIDGYRLRAAHTVEWDSHFLIRRTYFQVGRRIVSYKSLMTLTGGSLKVIAQYPVRVNIYKLLVSLPVNRSLWMLSDWRHLLL